MTVPKETVIKETSDSYSIQFVPKEFPFSLGPMPVPGKGIVDSAVICDVYGAMEGIGKKPIGQIVQLKDTYRFRATDEYQLFGPVSMIAILEFLLELEEDS